MMALCQLAQCGKAAYLRAVVSHEIFMIFRVIKKFSQKFILREEIQLKQEGSLCLFLEYILC